MEIKSLDEIKVIIDNEILKSKYLFVFSKIKFKKIDYDINQIKYIYFNLITMPFILKLAEILEQQNYSYYINNKREIVIFPIVNV